LSLASSGQDATVDAQRGPDRCVTIDLSCHEALVLSDLLHRWERDGTETALPFDHLAERRVWNDFVATLEPVIDEVFSADYDDVVSQAGDRLTPGP
jgi:hypothetical protein